jgi:hypothetical protein
MSWLKKMPLWGWAVLMLVVFVLPVPVVTMLEEQDAFCIQCHTIPEATYYERAQNALAGTLPYTDLASGHYGADTIDFRCIDCHRGAQTPAHRVQTLFLGAKDSLVWLSGQADPSIEKLTTGEPHLVEASCINCHTDSILELGFNNHFHNLLPQSYAAYLAGGEPSAPPEAPNLSAENLRDLQEEFGISVDVLCLDCHRGHQSVPGSEQFYYLDVNGTVFPACVTCHNATQRGPQRLEDLSGG